MRAAWQWHSAGVSDTQKITKKHRILHFLSPFLAFSYIIQSEKKNQKNQKSKKNQKKIKKKKNKKKITPPPARSEKRGESESEAKK
jgi:hypothetical protein